MLRIAEDSEAVVCEGLQLCIVPAQVNVDIWDVVWGALVPEFRVARDIVGVADDGRLAVLGCHRPVNIEAIQPQARSVEHLACVLSVLRLDSMRMMQIDVCGDAATRQRQSDTDVHTREMRVPNCEAQVYPRAVFFPLSGGNRVQRKQHIGCDSLDALLSANERRTSGKTSAIHSLLVQVWASRVEP